MDGAGRMGQGLLTTTLWEEESTICWQVMSGGVCVARRAGGSCFSFSLSSRLCHDLVSPSDVLSSLLLSDEFQLIKG